MLKDYPNYDVDENGVVINLKTGKILKSFSDTTGYHQVNLCKDGKRKRHQVHRLVAEKYLQNFSPTLEVDHIDRNRKNNLLSNLRIVTHQQNTFNTSAKGYSFNKKTGKYRAYICINGNSIHLGYYELEADAAAAYVAAKEKYHSYA